MDMNCSAYSEKELIEIQSLINDLEKRTKINKIPEADKEILLWRIKLLKMGISKIAESENIGGRIKQ